MKLPHALHNKILYLSHSHNRVMARLTSLGSKEVDYIQCHSLLLKQYHHVTPLFANYIDTDICTAGISRIRTLILHILICTRTDRVLSVEWMHFITAITTYIIYCNKCYYYP